MPTKGRSLPERFLESTGMPPFSAPALNAFGLGPAVWNPSKRPDQAPADTGTAPVVATEQPLPLEFIALYRSVEALRTNERGIVVQFAGASGRENSGTVASGFARAAGTAAGSRSVLYVDCDPAAARDRSGAPVPRGLTDTFLARSPLTSATVPARDATGVSWARLGAATCGSADMARLLGALRERFAFVVLDCPSGAMGAEVMSLARHCDGTILVVAAKRTRARAVAASREIVERIGGQVVGTVFDGSTGQRRWFGRAGARAR